MSKNKITTERMQYDDIRSRGDFPIKKRSPIVYEVQQDPSDEFSSPVPRLNLRPEDNAKKKLLLFLLKELQKIWQKIQLKHQREELRSKKKNRPHKPASEVEVVFTPGSDLISPVSAPIVQPSADQFVVDHKKPPENTNQFSEAQMTEIRSVEMNQTATTATEAQYLQQSWMQNHDLQNQLEQNNQNQMHQNHLTLERV